MYKIYCLNNVTGYPKFLTERQFFPDVLMQGLIAENPNTNFYITKASETTDIDF